MICIICNANKEIDEFPSNGKGGKRSQCKVCMRAVNLNWRKNHAEHIKNYNLKRKIKNIAEQSTGSLSVSDKHEKL